MKSPCPTRRTRRGFTLIELLIVVAIIAILAAIAVPNFLEAQVRSKVSRVHSDMRTLATGIEAYRVDWNLYPWSTPNRPEGWKYPSYDGTSYVIPVHLATGLSTPVAYLTTAKYKDPFTNSQPVVENFWYIDPGGGGQESNRIESYGYDKNSVTFLHQDVLGQFIKGSKVYGLFSMGPDTRYYDAPWAGGLPGNRAYYSLYDTTNGTTSRGNIWRFGP